MKCDTTRDVRLIAVFGDIRGFSSFYESVTHPVTERDPFLNAYDDLITEILTGAGLPYEDTGDGFICLVDLGSGKDSRKAAHVLRVMWTLLKRVQRLIARKEYPYPDGYRIRLAVGYATRKVKRDGKVVVRGKHINLAHKMLKIEPSIGIVCHETMTQLISKRQAKKCGFKFKHLPTDRRIPEGMSKKDASALWAFSANRPPCRNGS